MPPRAIDIAALKVLFAPWQWLTAPRYYGLDNVPCDRPALLAGNHTVMGLLDAPLMVLGLYERRGIFVRSLGDHIHFRIPGWRTLLAHYGVVEGDRERCGALMRARETILVFPGGAREVFKRKGEKYHLIWGQRTGFARLAIEHGYPIVPFAAVGAEECYDIVLDAGDVLGTPLGPLLRRLVPRADEMPPIVRGLGPTLLPRPQRFYFAFGAPIETVRFAGRHDDEATCFAVREQCVLGSRPRSRGFSGNAVTIPHKMHSCGHYNRSAQPHRHRTPTAGAGKDRRYAMRSKEDRHHEHDDPRDPSR